MATSLRDHPVIALLRAQRDAVAETRHQRMGEDFAAERGWLSPDEREAFAALQASWPWTLSDLRAHEDRVRLDHPDLFAAWIREEIGRARREGRPTQPWQALRDRHPAYRIDVIEGVPRGDLFELELPITWRVTDLSTGAVVHEAHGVRTAEHQGTWVDGPAEGTVAVRVVDQVVQVRNHIGDVTEHPLPPSG